MTLTFNPKIYGDLLLETIPKEIETESEYEQILSIVEELTFKQDRTPEETVLHKLLVILVETYERENYPISASSPDEILRHIMAASGTRQADLIGIIGTSTEVSELVKGDRAISEPQAAILGERFKVSPSLFCD